jgi:alginate O-acetyltransferase complex protein AlgJ
VSPSSAVIKGRDGWLFYGDDSGADDYVNRQPLSPVEVSAWRDAVTHAREWLERRHIAYVFTIAPDKHLIYPEFMPASIQRVGAMSRMDQVYAALSDTSVVTVDSRRALLEAKARERIYYVTDTHWNERGALVAYQAIIEAVRRQAPSVPPAWTRSDFDATHEEIAGKDLAGMLGMKDVLHETDLRLIPHRARRARVIGGAS